MSDTRYHPPVRLFWWTTKRSYFLFVMRELSSLFVAWLVLFLILLVRAVSRGEAAYESFWDWADTPWVVAINLLAFAFLVLHTVTWFNLTPQAMDLRLRGRRLPASAIIGAQYGGLLVVSAAIAWLVLR
ncbi:fumarate reductase subunit C [Nocardioides speluncae]|uniref:fumarate reductase subunit C n=1 Tax=Nocardioides speluncae TaxID=2670337 RepID=UPI000D69C70E|nr:fumarate reductase subunit C [Nocardioides speluncae]